MSESNKESRFGHSGFRRKSHYDPSEPNKKPSAGLIGNSLSTNREDLIPAICTDSDRTAGSSGISSASNPLQNIRNRTAQSQDRKDNRANKKHSRKKSCLFENRKYNWEQC